jgi:hypothetical protein
MSAVSTGFVTPPNTLPEFLAGDSAITVTSAAIGGNFFVLTNPGRNDYPTQNLMSPQNTGNGG